MIYIYFIVSISEFLIDTTKFAILLSFDYKTKDVIIPSVIIIILKTYEIYDLLLNILKIYTINIRVKITM